MIPQKWIDAYLWFLLKYRHHVSIVVALVTVFFCYSLKELVPRNRVPMIRQLRQQRLHSRVLNLNP